MLHHRQDLHLRSIIVALLLSGCAHLPRFEATSPTIRDIATEHMDADARKDTQETLKKFVGSLLVPREMLGALNIPVGLGFAGNRSDNVMIVGNHQSFPNNLQDARLEVAKFKNVQRAGAERFVVLGAARARKHRRLERHLRGQRLQFQQLLVLPRRSLPQQLQAKQPSEEARLA